MTMADAVTFITALVGAVSGVGGLIISYRSSMASARRNDVETLRIIIAELRARVSELECEVGRWRTRYYNLVKRVRKLGIEEDVEGC